MLALASIICLVVAIADGDTLTARCSTEDAARPYQQVKVRLAEIDAPERKQPFGSASRQHLAALCFKTEATIRQTATDRYGRTVARVECRGRDANLEMVKAGMAWAYTKYQTDSAFASAERAARDARIGLWADLGGAAAPVAPWEWRQRLFETR